MTNVAFWYDRPQQYAGGLNYLKNLLYAISQAADARIVPFVFIGKQFDPASVEQFRQFATVIQTGFLDRGTLAWYAHRAAFKWFGAHWFLNYLMRKYRIDVVSHAEHVYGDGLPFRLISWIPDLQYLHLPELFPELDTTAESRRWAAVVEHSDAVVVSSHAALEDVKSIVPAESVAHVHVLQFVSQPGWIGAGARADLESIRAEHGFSGRFFFLPNQFWAHKNHRVVFEAVHRLKQRNIDVLVLCTGNLRDYRIQDDSYPASLRAYIAEHGLEANIRILGMIAYAQVLQLMRSSVAVINPSRFEGWSSTVEEARSMGQRLVLSNIPVHLEQDPPRASYFPPDDADALADILLRLWNAPDEPVSAEQQAQCLDDLRQRTLRYGRLYLDLVLQTVAKAARCA